MNEKNLKTEEAYKYLKENLKEKVPNFEEKKEGSLKIFYFGNEKVAYVRHSRKFSIRSKYVQNNNLVKVQTIDDIDDIIVELLNNTNFSHNKIPEPKEVEKEKTTTKQNELIPDDFVYIPRNVETGETDIKEFEDAMKQCKNVLLEGPTGSGKTSLVRKYCAKHQKPYRRLSLNGGITVEDLVGHYVLKQGESPWIDGILTRAVREGWVLAIDEINAASPEVLFVLNSLLDDERILILSAKDGEVIKPHPDFRLIATMNPSEQGYAGTNEMNEALMDRFHTIMNIDYNIKVEEKILKQMGLDSEKLNSIMEFTNKIREAYAKSEIFTPWSTRSVINFAENLIQGKEKLLVNRFKSSDRDTVRDLMDTFIYKQRPVEKQENDEY